MFLYFHDDHLTRGSKNQKTYSRLFGMIFLGGSGSMEKYEWQPLATEKIFKNRKTLKKNVILFPANALFSTKTA